MIELNMGVNATGTLGGRRSSAEDARIEAPYIGGEGLGLGRGCAPSQKIYEFFISKWCDMVHSDENDSDLRYSEMPLKGKKIKHLSKYWAVVDTGRPLQVKYWGVATPATPATLTPMLDPARYTSNNKLPRCW